MKKATFPTRKFDMSFGGNQWLPRVISCGRLLVDTFLTAKELIRETSYDLGALATSQLKKSRKDYDEDMLPNFYKASETLIAIANHTETDAFLTFELMQHLQIIPLTKQLTTIAGNLWYRSL